MEPVSGDLEAPGAPRGGPGGLGRCVCCFWLAVAFDAAGLAVLLIGVFANIFFYDLLIYAGAIIIFLSLVWWLFWYSGNIEVPPAELRDDVGLLKKERGPLEGVGGAVRRLSRRVSAGIRSSLRRNGGPTGSAPRGAAPHRAAPHQGEQVDVAMATMTPREVTREPGCDVEMPQTSTETSPA